MKNQKVIMVLRIILGLVLVIFGINKFANFMPFPPLPDAAAEFMGALGKSGYIFPIVGIIEIVVGIMLLINKYVPLALLLLAPISVNIFAFHAFMDIGGIGGAALVTILNIVLFFAYKDRYKEVLSV